MKTAEGSKKKKNKILRVVTGIVAALLIVCIIAAGLFKLYIFRYYRADNRLLNVLQNIMDEQVHAYYEKDGAVFLPQQDYKAVIVFYPGGKVEFTAYAPLMYELASKGYLCLLPRMPENLAILRVDAVEKIGKGHNAEVKSAEGLDWYIAGHSLGGVAAATYLGGSDPGSYKGIILCASYTTTDFSDTDFRLLSIYGSEDKVMSINSYEESKALWPEDASEQIIEGGIHSYFGSYGIQSGDGTPAITNEEQISITAEMVDEWISGS